MREWVSEGGSEHCLPSSTCLLYEYMLVVRALSNYSSCRTILALNSLQTKYS